MTTLEYSFKCSAKPSYFMCCIDHLYCQGLYEDFECGGVNFPLVGEFFLFFGGGLIFLC